MESKSRILFYYLLLLVFHFGHVLEEVWGHFWLLSVVGIGLYLFINWILFFIPVVLLYFVMRNKIPAYYLSIAYAAFMALQGLGHNVATLVTGRYFDGFAGGVSGIGLIITGIPLSVLLYHSRPLKGK